MNAKEFVASARQNYPNLPNTETLALLEQSPEFIFAVCGELYKNVTAADRDLVLYITNLYVNFYKEPNGFDYEFNDPFRMCGLLLYKIANVEDSLLLWQIKEIDMDTGCGLETQMLTGAGVDETIAYLRGLKTEFALRGARHIELNREDFFDFVEAFEDYFGIQATG